jgi:hypothetical protein
MTANARALTCLLPWACGFGIAVAQDIEPRRWTHLPVGTNVLGVGYLYTTGDIGTDPVSRLQDVDLELHTAVVSYNHYFPLFEKTARLDVQLPFQSGHWEGLVDGVPAAASRDGLADPRIRLSVNFAGAPALRGQEFLEYQQQHETNTAVGAALALWLPLGEYKEDKLINLGQNRFVIEPQLGVVHTRGPWSFELTGSAFLYTDNDEFFGGSTLEQDPFYTVQAHVVRTFKQRWWVSAGAAYGWGGESKINGVNNDDQEENLLYGLSFGFPVGSAQAVRLGYARGRAFADVGTDSHSFLVSWTLRF